MPSVRAYGLLVLASLIVEFGCSRSALDEHRAPNSAEPDGGWATGGTSGGGPGGAAGSGPCVNDGRTYAVGESFKVDCNTCTCGMNGLPGISCTMMWCMPDGGALNPGVSAATAGDRGSQPAAGRVCRTGLNEIMAVFPRIQHSGWIPELSSPLAVGNATVDEISGRRDPWSEVPPYEPQFLGTQRYHNLSLSPASAPDQGQGSALSLYLGQMASSDQATELYRWYAGTALYRTSTWIPVGSIGEGARIANIAGDWWINFHACNYYVELRLNPSYGPPPDYQEDDPTQKAAAIAFAAAVASAL